MQNTQKQQLTALPLPVTLVPKGQGLILRTRPPRVNIGRAKCNTNRKRHWIHRLFQYLPCVLLDNLRKTRYAIRCALRMLAVLWKHRPFPIVPSCAVTLTCSVYHFSGECIFIFEARVSSVFSTAVRCESPKNSHIKPQMHSLVDKKSAGWR